MRCASRAPCAPASAGRGHRHRRPDRPTAAADAIRAGVFDVLPRPPSARDLEALIANAREQAALAAAAPRNPSDERAAYGIVGTSPAMRIGHGSGPARRRRALRHPDLRRARHRTRDDRARDPRARRRIVMRRSSKSTARAHARRHRAAAVRRDQQAIGERRTGAAQPRTRRPAQQPLRMPRQGILFLENATGAAGARAGAARARAARPRSLRRRRPRIRCALDIRPIASVDGTIEAALDEGRMRADLLRAARRSSASTCRRCGSGARTSRSWPRISSRTCARPTARRSRRLRGRR